MLIKRNCGMTVVDVLNFGLSQFQQLRSLLLLLIEGYIVVLWELQWKGKTLVSCMTLGFCRRQ